MVRDVGIDPVVILSGDNDRRTGVERRHQPEIILDEDNRANEERRRAWNPAEHNAEEQVKAFLNILKDEYGIRPEDLRSFRHDLQWMRAHHRQMEKWAGHVGYGAIMTLVGGVLFALWEGIKHFIQDH